MSRFASYDRSRSVALWLFSVAALVFIMIVVGGATRLTGSGLSITEWKPIMGALPPMNPADWDAAFGLYQQIPQYQHVNADMTMAEFKVIFWWEWAHRLLGRAIGVAFAAPFVLFLAFRALPGRLVLRCLVLLALGGLQGLIGWWMVTSGLSERIDVAPERLTVHLGLALLIFAGLIWTGLEAWFGRETSRSPVWWSRGAALLLAAVFIQCLLGGLVAGSKAGMIHTDWPLMSGAFIAPVDWSLGAVAWLHDLALVQFNHRIWGYALTVAVLLYALQAFRWRLSDGVCASAYVLAIAVVLQAVLGILTLIHAVPISLGVLHQAGAALVLAVATVNLWLVRRSQPRLFSGGPRMRLFLR